MRAAGAGTALFVLLSPFIFASPGYSDDPITSAILNPIQNKADEIIDRATQSGDALAKTLGEEIRNSIQVWKKANSALLNQAFSSLDEQEKKTFNHMKLVLATLDSDERVLMGDAQRLSSEIAVMEKNLPFTNHDAEMWDYKPRVILPSGNKVIAIRIIGPKIASANPSLNPPGQSLAIEIDKTSDNELLATLSRSSIQFTDDGSNYVRYKFTFENPSHSLNPFSKDNVVERDLVFWALPKTMAHYVISPTVTTSLPPDHSSFWADVAPHGKDSTFPVSISEPPDMIADGWVIDTGALLSMKWGNPAQSGGSYCAGVDRNSIKSTSFVYNVQLGHNTGAFGHKSDGMAECRAAVPVTRIRTTTGPGQVLEGDLNWTDDANPSLPAGTQKYNINLKMFDGRSYLITDDSNVPYGVVEIQRQGNTSVLFRPHPPSDF